MSLNLKKKFPCFNEQQQQMFDALTGQQKKYVYFRAQGKNKKDSYILAGYKESKSSAAAAQMLERRTPQVFELIEAMSGQFKIVDIYNEESEKTKALRELEKIKANEFNLPMPNAVDTATKRQLQTIGQNLDKLDFDTVQRINFYRDISTGKIKTVKTTCYYDENGNLKSKKVEEVDDVNIRMNARKELDKIIGVTSIQEVGQISAGNINIMIVDASKKEELPPSNVIDLDKIETINGEQVLVTEEKEEKA